MDREFKDPVRIAIQGSNYILLRNRDVDGRMSQDKEVGSGHVLTRFAIADANKPDKFIGGIIFYESLLVAFGGDKEHKTYGKDSDSLGFALANLVPYLNLDMPRLFSNFENGAKLLGVLFDYGSDGYKNDLKQLYIVQTKDGFFETARRLVFPNGTDKKTVRRKILEILLNHQDEHPGTNIPYVELLGSLPITEKEALTAIQFLKDEDNKIEVLNEPADQSKIVSLRIKSGGVAELEGTEAKLKGAQIGVYQETHIDGNNNTVVNNVQDINIVFGDIKQELEVENAANKAEVLKNVEVLEAELKKPKDLGHIQKLFEKVKSGSAWVGRRLEPIVQQVAADIISGRIQPPTV